MNKLPLRVGAGGGGVGSALISQDVDPGADTAQKENGRQRESVRGRHQSFGTEADRKTSATAFQRLQQRLMLMPRRTVTAAAISLKLGCLWKCGKQQWGQRAFFVFCLFWPGLVCRGLCTVGVVKVSLALTHQRVAVPQFLRSSVNDSQTAKTASV